MEQRAIRSTVLTLLLAVSLASAFFLWNLQQQTSALGAAEDALAERLERVREAIGDVGTALQAYVAPGQLDEPWFERTSALLEQIDRDLALLRHDLASPDATAAFEALNEAFMALGAADGRIRQNLLRGQELMAADVVFSDGRNLVDTMTAQLVALHRAERADAHAERAALELERWSILGVTAVLWLVAVVVLVLSSAPAKVPTPVGMPAVPSSRPDASAPPAPSVDLAAVAGLCTDLSRVTDAAALATLLARVASVVEASGVTLWLGAGDQLFAVLGHGYSHDVLARFGPIARNANNALATAWRTGRPAAVTAEGPTGCAAVVPLLGPHGCVGVMGLESRSEREFDPARMAVAAMIAAQVAPAVATWPAPSVPHGAQGESSARSA